ncbi:EF-hand calcium-binding domain-containing protein 6 isoform X2 [Xenopus laevis]|uniref:EF-hand calcium-binding domain-containing protein 6 isoform X2 n=1 Tax=Xenopus laevis TaxID=8355 RepID=A0A8J1L911_XENLA|nr:EF-hand calcium-binding domain-containing protein 6 isoform X2 [Xenopus laevis]
MAALHTKGPSAPHPKVLHPVSRLGSPKALSVCGTSNGVRGGDPHSLKVLNRKENILDKSLGPITSQQLNNWETLDHWANLGKSEKNSRERERKEEEEGEVYHPDAAQIHLQAEELEYQLFDKLNSGGFYRLKSLFWSSDPEARGRVKRDALLVILTTFMGRYISERLFQDLLQRLHLGEQRVITFDGFYDRFKKEENRDPPEWLDPHRRKHKATVKAAHHVHLELKDLANNRHFELARHFSKDALNASEFRAVLSKLGLEMTEREFPKLWNRYVGDGAQTLGMEELMSRLGDQDLKLQEKQPSPLLTALEKVSGTEKAQPPKTSRAALSNAGKERKLSLNIEKWLKEKFREGARAMMAQFLLYDPQKTGKVNKEEFLAVLEKFQLQLSSDQLGHFLARCGLDEAPTDVNYLQFLQTVQSRHRNGTANQAALHRGRKANSLRSQGTFVALEEKLEKIFHSDFNVLLSSFQCADSKKQKSISQRDFRAILQERFSIQITDEDFKCLLEKLPVDPHGGIKYLDFMDTFDCSRSLSLCDEAKTVVTETSRKPKATKQTGDHKERSVEQLAELIKQQVRTNYGSIEAAFSQMDGMNSRRLSAEGMYQLLKSCDIRPQISREEAGKLLKTLILNQDQTLDFYQFIRHFGFSIKSSCFPNAKICPPVAGDGDFWIRSRKLNSDTKIIANILQSKVEFLLDDVRAKFKELDPLSTGCVTREEFVDFLQDLNPDLTQYQCDTFADKFSTGQNRVSYVQFLQPYQSGRSSFKQNQSEVPKREEKGKSKDETVQQGLMSLTSVLRQKLSSVHWRNLHQACQKLDRNGTGLLHLRDFRSVLRLCNIVLDEDEIFRIMSHYDKDLAGKLDYNRLLSDHKRSN